MSQNTELLGRFKLVLGETVTDDADPGTILKQDPGEDKEVGESVTEITVTVSGGPQIIEMIDIYDMEYSRAYSQLREMGLKPATPTYQNHETVEQGRIISFTPLAGTPLSPGTEVQMVVSKGPEVVTFSMPLLENMTEENALKTLDTYNLVKGRVDPISSDTVDVGKVVTQYPAYNTQVSEGTQVNLQISTGPEPGSQEPEPPVPAVVTRTVSVALPPDADGLVNFKVLDNGQEIFNQSIDAAMQTHVPVEVTGTGTKVLAIFVNGVACGTQAFDLDQPEE